MRVLEIGQVDVFVEVDKVVFAGMGKDRVGMTGGGTLVGNAVEFCNAGLA